MRAETRVRVGVIGTTPYAESHLRNITSHPGAELVAVVGRDADKAATIAERYGAASVYPDYQSMIDSGTVDAVVIIAPDELHHPITMHALDAGLHVLCEKPLATTASDALAMHERAVETGLVNMSFFALRNSVHHRYLKTLIDDGYLGRVYTAQLTLAHGFFRGDHYQWRFDQERGTGALGDLACYLIDQARWYVGDIDRVSASLSSFVERPHPDARAYAPENDSAVLAVEFASGAHGTITANAIAHQAERLQTNVIVLQGEGGTLELQHTFAGAQLRGARDGDDRFDVIEIPGSFWAGVDPANPGEASQMHSVGDRAFIDAIQDGGTVEPSFRDGWKVQQVIEAGFEAARTGQWTRTGQNPTGETP